MQETPDEHLWAILHVFVDMTKHLYGYWAVESINTKRAALEEIQPFIET